MREDLFAAPNRAGAEPRSMAELAADHLINGTLVSEDRRL